jgi:hypothetical protein
MVCAALLYGSCTVQKRHYRKGLYFCINKRNVPPPSIRPRVNPSPVVHRGSGECSKAEALVIRRSPVIADPAQVLSKTINSVVLVKSHRVRPLPVPVLPNSRALLNLRKDIEPTHSKINVLALLSFITGLFFFLLIPAVPAVLLGAISIRQMRKSPELYKGRWLGTAGVVLLILWGGAQFYFLLLGIMAIMCISAILLFV